MTWLVVLGLAVLAVAAAVGVWRTRVAQRRLRAERARGAHLTLVRPSEVDAALDEFEGAMRGPR